MIVVGVMLTVVCVSYTTSRSEIGNTQPSFQPGPYQIVFGKVSATLGSDKNAPSEIEKLICFKINTSTGEVWKYEDKYISASTGTAIANGFYKVNEFNFSVDPKPGFFPNDTNQSSKTKTPSLEEMANKPKQ